MTLRDKLSMFFDVLLQEVENIDNQRIKEIALKGLESNLKYHIEVIRDNVKNINKQQKENNNG